MERLARRDGESCLCLCVCVRECARSSQYVTRSQGCRGNSAEGCSLHLAVMLCFGRTNTHCDCTHALYTLLTMAGRGHRMLEKKQQERGKRSCSLKISPSAKMRPLMQNDDIFPSQHCSNIDSFPEWIFHSYTFWLCKSYSRWTKELIRACGPQARVMLCGF